MSTAAAVTCVPLNPGITVSEFDFYMADLKSAALLMQRGVDSPASTGAS